MKGQKKVKSMSPISSSGIKSLLRSTLSSNVRISEGAVERLRALLTEQGKWIAMEAEKITKYAGQRTVTEKEIRDAVAAFFGSLRED